MNTPDKPDPPAIRSLLYMVGLLAVAVVLFASFLAWSYFQTAEFAARQPGCPSLRDTVMAWCFTLLAVVAAVVSMTILAGRRVWRLTAIGMLLLFLALPVASVLASGLDRAQRGALGVLFASNFRSIGYARNIAESNGVPHAETLMLLLYERSITPEIIIDHRFSCPRCPPMPLREAFNYTGITMDDALLRRVTREQIIEAANATLGDAPWEHIGWTWFIRDARAYAADLDPNLIVGGGVLYMYGGMRAIILHADGNVVTWRQNQPDLREKYEAALAAAEAAGVAPPPDELHKFVEQASP